MRRLLLSASLLVSGWCSAQSFFPGSLPYQRWYPGTSPWAQLDSNVAVKKKWSLQPYGGLSAGMLFWKGGNASYLSAPIGLQLTRSLSPRVFAFASVSAAPSLVRFGQLAAPKNAGLQGMYKPYQLGVYSRAELGLGYTNEAHTFQITGSIGIQRNDYPFATPTRLVPTNQNSNRYIK
jgi:hypothetical protein